MACPICHDRQCRGCPTPEEIAQRAAAIRRLNDAAKLDQPMPKLTPVPTIKVVSTRLAFSK